MHLRRNENLDTMCYGAVGRSAVLQELTTRLLVGKTDPATMFDELRPLYTRHILMFPVGMNSWMQDFQRL